MNTTYISQTIREFFTTNYNETPYALQNLPFDTPNAPWVRLNILFNDSELTSLGTNRSYRQWGNVICQIFVPRNTGTAEAERLSDIIGDMFTQLTVDGVTFRLPEATKTGLIDNYDQTNISVEFSYYVCP